MAAGTTHGKLYLITEKTLEKIEIQFVPLELSFNRTLNIQTIGIVGRNNPLHQYSGSEKSLSFQLDFYSEQDNRQDVIDTCRKLESWSINDGYSKPPERIKLVFGELFANRDEDNWWIIKSAPFKISNFDKPSGYFPMQAYVELTLGLDTNTNLLRAQVR